MILGLEDVPQEIPAICLNAFNAMMNSALTDSTQETPCKWMRGPEPHRMTKYRQKKAAEDLKKEAAECGSLEMYFARQSAMATGATTSRDPMPPGGIRKLTRKDVLLAAIRDLKKRIESKDNILAGQNLHRHQAVLGFLHLQLKDSAGNSGKTRAELSQTAAMAFGCGTGLARRIVQWERSWISERKIETGKRGCHEKIKSLFNDEGVLLAVRNAINKTKQEKLTSEVIARAVKEYLQSEAAGNVVQETLNHIMECHSIGAAGSNANLAIRYSSRTARRWLAKLGFEYRSVRKGVYVDGHEREDVVAYRAEFLSRLQELKPRIVEWDEEGNEKDFTVPEGQQKIVIVTHDESTFHANDSRRQVWVEKGKMPLRPKGMGKGIMVSDFLYPRGRLAAPPTHTNERLEQHHLRRYAGELFEYSKDNYWTAEKMINQVKSIAIPLFELAWPKDKYQALFMFDNSSNHSCMPEDALNVWHMNLKPGGKQAHMRPGVNSRTGEIQPMDFDNGTQKGVKVVLQERGLWHDKLRLDCSQSDPQDIHPIKNFCCARHILASEPDFKAHQVSILEEVIMNAGHQALFYPRFHCELNAIEYYWGSAKQYTRENCDYSFPSLRTTVPLALQSVSSSTISRFFQTTERMMEYYRNGIQYGSNKFKEQEHLYKQAKRKEERVYKSHRRVGIERA